MSTHIESVIKMSKTKSISDLVIDLQKENDSLQKLKKAFEKAVKGEFGYNIDELHIIINKQEAYERRKAEKQSRTQFTEQSEIN